MAISKRLRYEVLRRDGYTCRYCGAKVPDVKMTVDHVVPKALGGSDTDPANFVAACEPCNSGKTSSSPDAPLVADVAEQAGKIYPEMCRGRGERIEMCPERGSHWAKIAECGRCTTGPPEGMEEHKGHLLCDRHIEQLRAGEYVARDGKRLSLADLAPVANDEWVPF